jgi:predicted Holliday junction resolvase-like endonuclease
LVNQPNLTFSNMSSDIDPKNVIMVTLEEISEEQCKAFEAHQQAAEEHRKTEEAWKLEEFLACFKKERQGKVTQVKEVILPSTSGKDKVMPTISTSSSFVSPKDVTGMLNDHTKHLSYPVPR